MKELTDDFIEEIEKEAIKILDLLFVQKEISEEDANKVSEWLSKVDFTKLKEGHVIGLTRFKDGEPKFFGIRVLFGGGKLQAMEVMWKNGFRKILLTKYFN
ncbi:MAG: hypothetical protein N2692_00335 [Patescibacteria group bacterium]|nr:hypothetical protein [Patescibacteria group bacterium]